MLEIGSLVDGKYKILNKVGQGGMSVVYLAMNEKANKQWAVKEVRKDGIKDFEVVKQGLVAETDILKKLNHPNLPSIIDVIDTDDSFIIIMDYIQGNSLNKALDEFGAQPQEYVISWAKQLCDVLGYLHSRTPAIIYRDMKPANVMLKPDGNVTLIDFGTAREFKEKNLADTTCLGTVGYAAPEQFGGMGQTDARTDIYCLGATLYHLVTGMNPCEPPYEIKPIREINPSLSGGLERIILKCTQRDPNDRYQSAEELMYALEHYEEIDDIYRKKQKKKLSAFITTLSLAVVFGATSLWGYLSAEKVLKSSYDSIINEASAQTTVEKQCDKYISAILVDTSRIDAYLEIKKAVQSDFEISAEEMGILTSLTMDLYTDDGTSVAALSELQSTNKQGYERVCFEIGMSILSYYGGDYNKDEERYTQAAKWFSKIRENDDKNGTLASLFCDMADCMFEISEMKGSNVPQTAEVADRYNKLWGMLQELQTEAESYTDDYKLYVLKEINRRVNTEMKSFYDNGIPREEMLTLITGIKETVNQTTTTYEEVQKQIDELKNAVEYTLSRISTIE